MCHSVIIFSLLSKQPMLSVQSRVDCSWSPIFLWEFSRLLCFDQTATILVYSSERNLGRVSKLQRGWKSTAAIGITAIVYWRVNLHQHVSRVAEILPEKPIFQLQRGL